MADARRHIAAAAIAALIALTACVVPAYADEVKDDASQVDYTQSLEEIKALIVELPDRDSVAAIGDKLEALSPAGETAKLEELETLVDGLVTVNVYQFGMQLVLVGVTCAFIFVFGFRRF